MIKENPTSILAAYFLSQCFSKSLVSKLGSYSSRHSLSRTLSFERERYLSQTEEAILKIRECTSIHQMHTLVRKLPLEIQYFVFERAMIMSVASQYHNHLILDVDISDRPGILVHKIFQLLHELWGEHLKLLFLDGIDLDTYMSNILHGHL